MKLRSLFRTKAAMVTLAGATFAFAFSPQTPLGQVIWPTPIVLDPAPTGAQTGLFVLLGVVTAIAFGGGLAFLLYGRGPVLRMFGPGREGLATAAHIAVFWVLANWWVHDSLHMVAGMHAGRLLAIEYAFHVTLMAAGAVLAFGVITVADHREAAPAH